MIKLLRTALFSVLIICGLGCLSYLIYFAPGQIKARAARTIGRYLALPPSISGVRQRWMGPLTIERIEVPAAPVIEQRDLLLLYNLELEETGGDLFALTGSGRRSPEGASIRIQRGKLYLDHEVSSGPGSLVSLSQWNWRDLFHDGALLREAALEVIRAGHRVVVGDLEVVLQEIRQRQEKSSWSARIEDLLIEGSPGGEIEVRGDLLPNAYWSEGQFLVRLRPEAGAGRPLLEAQGFLDNLHGFEEWLALLFPVERRLVAVLGPSGPITLNLNSLSYFPGNVSGAQAGGKLDYRATVLHYDSTFRVAPWGLEIRHGHGAMVVDPGGVSFGAAEGKEEGARFSGEIWGTEVDLRGRVGLDQAEVKIRLPETDLKSAAVSAQPKDLAAIWRRLRPAGTVSGELVERFGADPLERWSADLDFRDLSFEDIRLLGPATGKLSLKGAAGNGSAVLAIASATLEPLGKLSGEVPLEWSARSLSIRPAGLSVGEGFLFGEMEYLAAEGSFRGSLRLDRASLNCSDRLLVAARAAGKLEFASSPAGLSGQGAVDLEDVTLSAERLGAGGLAGGAQMLSFSKGQLLFTLEPEAIRPLRLDLLGESCALRLLGSAAYRGGLEAVAVLAVGEPARALGNLPAGSSPREWRQAIQDDGLPLRLSGNALRPRIRKVEWSDPLFQGRPAERAPASAPEPKPPPPPEPAKKT